MLRICDLYLLVYFASVRTDNVKPSFRILAPEFICPNVDDELVKPDETVVMVQTQAGVDLNLEWTVKWTPLPNPTQRHTLLLWKAVRELQTLLNKPPKDPYVYVIDNSELLEGVNYVITVTGTNGEGARSDPKTFQIDNTQGKKDLNEVDGRGPQMSVILLGGTKAVASTDFIVEAKITTCKATEDYHFEWTVKSDPLFHEVDVTKVKGSQLVIPANNLLSGINYEVHCTVVMSSTGVFLTQTSLEVEVLRRGLELSFAADKLVVNVNTPFTLEVAEYKQDNFDGNTTFDWLCKYKNEDCEGFVNLDSRTMVLEKGLPRLGSYEFTTTAILNDEMVTSRMYVQVIDAMIPTIQLTPIRRTLNEGSVVQLIANASNVAPSCNLTWYFRSGAQGEDNEHGKPLSETQNVYSLEENFLNDISDYTNETEWRQITADMLASEGRARFVAECGCSITFSCEARGLAYADVNFNINQSPNPSYVSVSPATGNALETIFRINTVNVPDENIPITYSFYSRIGDNDTLLLGAYSDHVSVETTLPYIDGSTEIWVEACDSLGACGTSSSFRVPVTKPDSNVHHLLDSVKGNVRRCEFVMMRRNIFGVVVSLKNAGLYNMLTSYVEGLSEILDGEDAKLCSIGNEEQYSEFLLALASYGVDL